MKAWCPHRVRWFRYCEECARAEALALHDYSGFVPVEYIVAALQARFRHPAIDALARAVLDR